MNPITAKLHNSIILYDGKAHKLDTFIHDFRGDNGNERQRIAFGLVGAEIPKDMPKLNVSIDTNPFTENGVNYAGKIRLSPPWEEERYIPLVGRGTIMPDGRTCADPTYAQQQNLEAFHQAAKIIIDEKVIAQDEIRQDRLYYASIVGYGFGDRQGIMSLSEIATDFGKRFHSDAVMQPVLKMLRKLADSNGKIDTETARELIELTQDRSVRDTLGADGVQILELISEFEEVQKALSPIAAASHAARHALLKARSALP